MPVYELTSPKTGRVYNVDAAAELPDDDIDALVNDLDFEAAREAGVQPGVDPAVLQQGPVGSFLQSIPQTFSKVGSGMIGGAGRILDKASESLSQATGLPKGGDMFQRMADYGDELSTSADLTFPTNPQNPVAGTIGSGAAQGLSLLAGGLAGKALTGSNVAMTAVPAASGFLSGANQGIQTAEEIGVQSPLAQLGTGMAFGGLEVLTERLGGIGSRAGTEALTRAVRQTAGQRLRSSGRAVGSEALEEVLAGRSQAALTRLIASEDPNNPGFTRTGVNLDALASEIVNLEAMKLEALGGAAGGTVFAGVQALANRQLPNDPTTSPNQTPAPTQPPAPGQPGAPAPMGAGAPGADVTLPDDTGELTAEEVQDLEMTNEEGRMTNAVRQPILQGVPDRPQRTARFQESSLNEEPIMEGDAITDLRIPRSPEAIAESQRIEAERQQQIATMRMLDARAQGMPLIPDSPSGSRDILDFANENPIYLPPGFSEERNLPEYEKLKEAKLPPYWRQFVASSKRGGNPSDVAQRAFDAGFIDAPTADAYLEAVRGGIEGRQQYRVQFAQRDKALQQEEERVVNFEQSQNKLARKRSTERVDFEDIRTGDAMTIDGEPAVVRNIEYDQDGYLTNVVIEDGKRFGLMQFDPQTRGGILVDEFQPRAQRSQEPAPLMRRPSPAPDTGGGTRLPADEWQKRIDDIETELQQQGVNIFQLYNPSDAGVDILAQEGWQPLPENLAEAYRLRDEAGARELDQSRQAIFGALQQAGFSQAEINRILTYYAIDPSKSDASQQYLAATHTVNTAKQNLNQQAESLAYALAAERGIPFDELKDVNSKTLRDAANAVKVVRAYLGLETASEQSRDDAPGFRHLVIDRDLEAGFMSGAGADALIDLAHRAFAAGRTFAQWAAAMVQRFGAAVRDYLAGVWDHAKRSSQTGALNFTSRLGDQLQQASQQTARPAATAAPLKAAYASALRGSSTAMIPLADVFAAAQAANPALTQEQFQAQVMTDYEAGSLMLEGAGSPQEAQNAGLRIDGTPVGTAVRMMVPQGFTHLDVSKRASQRAAVQIDSGTVREGPNETQSRFASPNAADRLINGPRTDELVTAEANAWLNSMDQQAAIEAFVSGQVPLSLDTAERAAATLIANLSEQAATAKTEMARMWAHDQGGRMRRIWTKEFISADPARALRQRGVVNNTILAPIAPVLAAQELLEDRAKKVIDNRFEGGTEGAVEKVKDIATTAGEQAGTDLAEQLEDTTSTATDPRIADLEARLKDLREQMQNRDSEVDTSLKETSSTWQKILNLLNSASERKSKLLNGVKGRVASMRKAAMERKAKRRAEGRLSANPIEDFADDVIIGTSLLAEGIVEFSNWSQALVREIGARSAADLRRLYAEASKEYLSLLEAEKARPATSLQSKHPSLKKMLDALRKKMFPGMTWADIFTQLPETQKARQREIYRRLMLDERLRNLTPQERLALTNELDKAWLRERRKVFMRELEKAKVLGEKKPKDREKVKAAAPRLLRLMNLGMLNSEMFREALAKEYGLNMIDAAAAADLRALGERIQKAPEGLPRRKLEEQLVERLQKLSGYTLWQVIDSWWTASVLSGWRTPVDIGLGVANGIEDIGLGSIVAALRSGNKDVAVRGLAALFGRIPSAFMEAVDHVATGNKAMMRSFELEVKQAMEGGNLLASDVGRQMWDRGGWRKVPGGFMIFYGRLFTALDHVNSASTREGAKALALARHPELYEKALRITTADRLAARQQARLEMTGGAVPATQQERIEENARVREILEQGIPAEMLAEATEVGRAAALQGEPTGLGGALLDAVLSAVSVVNRKAQELANRPNPDRLTRQGAAITAALVPMARAITGTKFARTVAHSINRTASYVPGLGAYAVGQQGRTGAFGDILAAKQVIGTLVGIALYLAFDDDDDEKGIEDSWKDKTPQQKAQLYAQGKQPFTIWTRDDRGRVRNWNYQQWGVAGIVNTVAAMLKQKGSEAGTLNVLMSSITQGAMSFTDKAQLQGLQTVFGENFRSTDPASGIAASLNKWAAQTVGGVVPRLVKDIDMVASPELRDTSEWWQKWAKEVPMLRQLSSGKRVDILGQDIQLQRGPLSRVTQLGTADPVYRLLGNLNARDVWLPDPSQGVRVVKFSNGTRRNMNPQEKDRYQRLTGAAYRAYLEKEGRALLQMSPEDAQEAVSKTTARLRSTAAYQATH